MSFIWMRIKNHFHINYFGCVRLGNLDLDFIIRISYLQMNAKSEKGISTLRYLFLHFLFTVRLGNSIKFF